MQNQHLRIAKELIELKYNILVLGIEFEDGSGNKFIVTESSNPAKKRFIVLQTGLATQLNYVIFTR